MRVSLRPGAKRILLRAEKRLQPTRQRGPAVLSYGCHGRDGKRLARSTLKPSRENLAAAVWAAISLFVAAPAYAATACPDHFALGREPELVNPKLAVETVALCFIGYGVLHSGQTRTPLWSAEHLTVATLREAEQTPRRNRFHAKAGLERGQRAEIADYVRSGYDRGHMSPSGDMPGAEAQGESFSLANVVPQAPRLNRGLWEGIECAVRTLARRDGEIYVVTGPAFTGGELQSLQGRVLIPTSTWKAIFDPRQNAAGVYLAANTDDAQAQSISVAQLRALTGIDPFPGLPEDMKQRRMPLPRPTPHGRGGHQ